MNTMEITKYVGAFCGSLLVFLLLSLAAHSIFDTSSDVVAYSIPVEDAAPEGDEVAPTVDVAALVAEADPASGEGQFRKCAACHKLDGSDGVGPHLNGVVNRPKAGVEGFGYSGPMASAGGEWTAEDLFGFLEDPKGYMPGTAMNFAGMRSPEDRADIIAYLNATSG